MTVRFGGDVPSYAISPNGQPLGGGAFTVFTDAALTVPAVLTSVTGTAIGNTVTARASGVYEFNAPDGTSVLYTSDGAGGAVALTPRPDGAYAPIGSVGGGIITGEVA